MRKSKLQMPADRGRLSGVSGSLLVRRFSVRQPEMYRVIEKVTAKKLTSIDEAALCELAQTVMDLEYDNVEGDFLDAGGGSEGAAIVIDAAKRRGRGFAAYAPPFENVPAEGPLAFAHLDNGKYEPMVFLLERLAPRLSPGGRLIVNQYKKEDCKRAVDEYFRGKSGFRLERKAKLHVIKNQAGAL
jgi:hypothetical protein